MDCSHPGLLEVFVMAFEAVYWQLIVGAALWGVLITAAGIVRMQTMQALMRGPKVPPPPPSFEEWRRSQQKD